MQKESITKNAIWNLLGQIAPIFIAIIAIPHLIKSIGVERFGFLSLAWTLVGYAGLFDLGISRAMTRVVANYLGQNNTEAAIHSAKVGTALMTILGVIIGFLLALNADNLVHNWLHVSPALKSEATNSLQILAASLPFILLTAAYRGALEASQSFRSLNIIRLYMGIFTYAAPLIASWFLPRLDLVIASITVMRLIATAAHAKTCKDHFAKIQPFCRIDKPTTQHLLRLGGWMSVSNLISPLLSYIDRFILGGLVPVAALAYYVTPYDMVTRALVVPYAVMAVLFPVMASATADRDAARKTYSTTVRFLNASMFPVMFTVAALAEPILGIWLGQDFAKHSALIMQLLSIGVFLNTVNQAPANVIQSAGEPRTMALAHLLELPIYLALLYYLTKSYGIAGTATAWMLRMLIDGLLLFGIVGSQKMRTEMPKEWHISNIAVVAILFGSCLLPFSNIERLTFWLVGLAAYGYFCWKITLSTQDKVYISSVATSTLRRLQRA